MHTHMDSEKRRCPLSDPSQPHYLSKHRYGPPPSDCFTCGEREHSPIWSNTHRYCEACDLHFHGKLCSYWPRKKRHPFHPHHPLSLVSESEALQRHGECDWCGRDLETPFYRCSICGFSLDGHCSKKDPPVTIANPKSHEHDLTLFPRPFLTPCDACGLVNERHDRDCAYACHRCNYFVHWGCIDLPRVIKIAHHDHRLSPTTHLPHGRWSPCTICYREVDAKYGAYSCAEGCPAFFHSKCATHGAIWDGKELEWEPEEPEDRPEDVEPFVKVGDKEISHFSHPLHHMRLEEDGYSNHRCHACVLPIGFGDHYSCMECELFLHAACASLPRKKRSVLSPYPLVLDSLPPRQYEHMICEACGRLSSGFRYNCVYSIDRRRLDVRCASISLPIKHKSHHHPLYHVSKDTQLDPICQGCNLHCSWFNLRCIVDGCGFVLCFRCVTFPDKVRYEHDEHDLLALCCGEESKGGYWCEVCERELNPKEWFYECDECGVTVHVECAFGSFAYMKFGHRFLMGDHEMEVLCNNSSSRPVCFECRRHCRDIALLRDNFTGCYFCSEPCFRSYFSYSD